MAGFPQSTVDRLVSKILPRGVRCDKKARSILNEAVTGVHIACVCRLLYLTHNNVATGSEFIQLLASEASRTCLTTGRAIMKPVDVEAALSVRARRELLSLNVSYNVAVIAVREHSR